MTKLCCFNQDNANFIAFERHVPGSLRTMSGPKNSIDLHPLAHHVWGAMLKKYHKLQQKPKTTDELKVVLQIIWEEHINKAVTNFIERLT